MKKLLPWVLLVLLIATVSWFLRTKPPFSEGHASDREHSLAEGSFDYDTQIRVRQQKEGLPESAVLDISGIMRQTRLAAGERSYLTAWDSLRQFEMMGQARDEKVTNALLKSPMLSIFDSKSRSFVHEFNQTFPAEFVSFHASMLQRIVLPVTLVEWKGKDSITRKERDEIGAFDAAYNKEEVGGQIFITKDWVRYGKSGIKVDGRDHAFRYIYNDKEELQSIQGRLTLYYRQTPAVRYRIEVMMKLVGPASDPVARLTKKNTQRMTENDIVRSGQPSDKSSVLTFEQAMAKVDAITETSDSGEAYQIFSSLKESLDGNSALVNEIVARIEAIKDRDPSSRRRLSVLFGALAQAQDPAISDTLAKLAATCPDTFCKIQDLL